MEQAEASPATVLGEWLIGLPADARLLDLGCGGGKDAGDLRQLDIALWAWKGRVRGLMHLPKSVARRILTDPSKIVRTGGLFAATVTYGVKSRIVTDGWIPGRYFARWKKDKLARAVRRAGWTILELRVVANRERKGRWLNLLAQKQS